MAEIRLRIETEVVDMPGVIAYGATEKQAMDAARVLALEVVGEKNQGPGEFA